MFQSLFYWITYSYFKRTLFFPSFHYCFNPYFIGLPILIMYKEKTMKMKFNLFQSLFYWITYSYTIGFTRTKLGYVWFQSLFYWITYSYHIGKLEIEAEASFQSLFYWITYSYYNRNINFKKRAWFQSLFYWITYSYLEVRKYLL